MVLAQLEVVAVDAQDSTVEVQFFDGTIDEIDLVVSLNQPSLRILADETRWLIDVKSLDKEVPNFLDFIWMDGLKTVRPEAVTIIY